MSEDIVLYTHPMSRGRVARWMLEEVGQPYRTEILGYGDAMRAPGFLAVNPMGKVPALRHGATVVTEVPAICAYLADAFPGAGLAPPPGDKRRGAYYRWLFFAAGPVEASATDRALGLEVPPDRVSMVGYGTQARVLDALEGVLSGAEYLDGTGFTAADLYLGAQLGWGMLFGTIERRPAFERYWERLSARPAQKRAEAIDDELAARLGLPSEVPTRAPGG